MKRPSLSRSLLLFKLLFHPSWSKHKKIDCVCVRETSTRHSETRANLGQIGWNSDLYGDIGKRGGIGRHSDFDRKTMSNSEKSWAVSGYGEKLSCAATLSVPLYVSRCSPCPPVSLSWHLTTHTKRGSGQLRGSRAPWGTGEGGVRLVIGGALRRLPPQKFYNSSHSNKSEPEHYDKSYNFRNYYKHVRSTLSAQDYNNDWIPAGLRHTNMSNKSNNSNKSHKFHVWNNVNSSHNFRNAIPKACQT